MAISLKEQLRQLSEGVHYHPPFVNVLKKGKEDPATRSKSTQMFYDFYAMELMHRLLGSPAPDPDVSNPKFSGKLTPKQASKFKASVQSGGENSSGAMFVPNWGDVEDLPKGISMVPSGLRRIIDDMYAEVVIALTKKIMGHLRLTLVQEFRYLTTRAQGWQSFRMALVGLQNKGSKITKQEFEKLIQQYIPGLKGHTETVKRLLKFSKCYQAMSPDPADHIPSGDETPTVGKAVKSKKPEPEPEPELPLEPGKPKTPDEPDDTDYNAPSVEIPPGADWGQDDFLDNPEIEKAKIIQWLKDKQGKKIDEGLQLEDSSYAAGRISPSTVKKVWNAINKSGLTWNDILLGYQNLDWGGAYGGPKWGEGVAAFVKLMPHAKNHDIEDMAAIVDHIYDLEHNTGELLNKGGMYVGSDDLDRRARITSLARYLPKVSPVIQRLILRVLKYTTKHPEIEQDITKVTESPTVPFTPEEQKVLTDNRFATSDGNEWTTQAPYENKKGQARQNHYTAKHHTNGMYSVRDHIDADIQIFDTWPEFEEWLKRNSSNFQMPQSGQTVFTPIKKQTVKQAALASHTNIKLDASKEQQLFDVCKMAWRPSQNYYKAYIPGNDRVQLFAFSDNSYLVCKKSNPDNVLHTYDWNEAFTRCKQLTLNAIPLPPSEDAEGKQFIGKPLGWTPAQSQPVVTPTVGSAVGQKQYELSPWEVQTLKVFSNNQGGVATDIDDDGFFRVKVIADGIPNTVLKIGKQALASSGQKYRVYHHHAGWVDDWAFSNWNITYAFIKSNWAALTTVSSQSLKSSIGTSSVTPQIFSQTPSAPMPLHSPMKASYTAHVGIDKPPTHTIRLTKEDEEALGSVGFEPKMVGSDVWYIHNKCNDVAKFYANNVANLMFPKTNTGVVLKKTVDEAIKWITNNDSYKQGKSPLVKPMVSNKGSKAGAMYEPMIANVGFVWDDASGKYVNNSNGDTLIIKPYPRSTLVSGGGMKNFNSLPELGAYLKSSYAPGVKKK